MSLRPAKNPVSSTEPYAILAEDEFTAGGTLEPVVTVFLSNRECPFRCVMCDLWKNTLDASVRTGDIPSQIVWALERLPQAPTIKLYNSGNFFDSQAVPPGDLAEIAGLLDPFERVIVENHPRLCNAACIEFSRMLSGRLEVAMGLETLHPDVLPRLNKRMTTQDFEAAAELLRGHNIDLRAFVLLNPPFLAPDEHQRWAVRSVEFADRCGAKACTIIPVRSGNGFLDLLEASGEYWPTDLETLESTHRLALAKMRSSSGIRVFADAWDLGRLPACPTCAPTRSERLTAMNRTQEIPPEFKCPVGCAS